MEKPSPTCHAVLSSNLSSIARSAKEEARRATEEDPEGGGGFPHFVVRLFGCSAVRLFTCSFIPSREILPSPTTTRHVICLMPRNWTEHELLIAMNVYCKLPLTRMKGVK